MAIIYYMYPKQKAPKARGPEDEILVFPAFSEVLRETKSVVKPTEPSFDESSSRMETNAAVQSETGTPICNDGTCIFIKSGLRDLIISAVSPLSQTPAPRSGDPTRYFWSPKGTLYPEVEKRARGHRVAS